MRSIASCAAGAAFVLLFVSTALAQPEQPQPPPPPPGPNTPITDKDLATAQQEDSRPWAKGVSPEQQRKALALFNEANGMLRDALFPRAAEKYREALTHWDHPAIHYNLALALMNVDQPIEAYENLQKSVVYGTAPLEKDKFDHAKEYMLLLEKQIANVEVSCDKPGAKVLVDGKEVFVAPGVYRARVRIGKHTFVAEKQGYQTRINAPFIGPGENFRIELKLYTAEELTRYSRRWPNATWVPYAVIGGGFAFAIAGVALELSAKSSYTSYDRAVAACAEQNMQACPTTSALTDIRASGDTKKTVGFVMYGLAGVTLATGVVLAVLNDPKGYQIRPEDLQQEQDKKRVSFTPVVSPTMAGAMVHGSF